MINLQWWMFIVIVVSAFMAGGFMVAMFGWMRTYRAAQRLLDLLDVISERENELATRMSEWNDQQERFDR
jgi:hypothetical protein